MNDWHDVVGFRWTQADGTVILIAPEEIAIVRRRNGLGSELEWLLDSAESLERGAALEQGDPEPIEELARINAIRSELVAQGLMHA